MTVRQSSRHSKISPPPPPTPCRNSHAWRRRNLHVAAYRWRNNTTILSAQSLEADGTFFLKNQWSDISFNSLTKSPPLIPRGSAQLSVWGFGGLDRSPPVYEGSDRRRLLWWKSGEWHDDPQCGENLTSWLPWLWNHLTNSATCWKETNISHGIVLGLLQIRRKLNVIQYRGALSGTENTWLPGNATGYPKLPKTGSCLCVMVEGKVEYLKL